MRSADLDKPEGAPGLDPTDAPLLFLSGGGGFQPVLQQCGCGGQDLDPEDCAGGPAPARRIKEQILSKAIKLRNFKSGDSFSFRMFSDMSIAAAHRCRKFVGIIDDFMRRGFGWYRTTHQTQSSP
ncbi:hypothetical protein NDU88_005073 [Pleurodeles waltl]|uniref:Uncharacterized protein n=1 Tax=Pleurodeles waltl TaxID=8319 RepID=A0AAV7WBP5_PLEWA|nr:hypothetical protein NDU88_005073 [Pleurodeles waltl]